MLPAQQRFHAGNAAAGDIPLGLIVKPELLALERVPQARLQRQALERIGIELLRIELKVVLSLRLRLIHGDIGILGQRLLIQAILRVGADADARRDAKFLAHQRKGLGGGRENFLCDDCRVFFVLQFRQQNDEFIPAERATVSLSRTQPFSRLATSLSS